MKKFYIFLVLLSSSLSMTAQTYLAQDFGRTSAEVKEFLSAKKDITVQSPSHDMITATTEGFRIEYYFNEGVLYKTLVARYYTTLKEANTAVDAFRTYYELLGASQMNMESGKHNQRFAAVHGREIHDVNVFQLEKGSIQLSQSKMDLDRCPGSEMKEIVENETLFAMISH